MTKYRHNNESEKLDIPEELMEIYRRPPESRTQNNINYLYQECKKLKFFKNLILTNNQAQLMIREIISRVEFSLFSKGKIIYSLNEPIINMLFVFEGEINIYEKQINKKPIRRELSGSPKKLPIPQEQNNQKVAYILSKGDIYGDEDIKKEKREMQVDAKTKCIIGFLSIQDYIFIFEKTNLLERNDIKEFLMKINIFKDINIIVLNNLCELIKIKKISKGEYLVKKGEPYNNIYLIRHGSFHIFFNTRIKIITEYDLESFSNSKKRSESSNIKYKFEKNCYDKLQYQIITLFSGEFIGDIEYYLGKEKYSLFARCTSDDTEVFEINANAFESICNRKIKNLFSKEIKKKIDYFEKRCKEIRKVHKNKNFGLKNKYKLMIIKNIEEENKDIFEKFENKAKYRNQLNDKKFNTIISSLSQRNNRLLTDQNNNYITNSLFFNKMNYSKKNNISIANQNNLNKIMKKVGSSKSPKKILLPYTNKKLSIISFSVKKEKPENIIEKEKNKNIINEVKPIKDKKLRLNENIKELLFNNNVNRNKSHKLNNLSSLRESKGLLSPLTDRNIYDFRNIVNIPDISKNFLIKYNSRDLKQKVSTIFPYKEKIK